MMDKDFVWLNEEELEGVVGGVHFWLFWRWEQEVASTFLSTHGDG